MISATKRLAEQKSGFQIPESASLWMLWDSKKAADNRPTPFVCMSDRDAHDGAVMDLTALRPSMISGARWLPPFPCPVGQFHVDTVPCQPVRPYAIVLPG